eukprot:756617-Hanusia_phi.AAC.2
MHPYFFISKTSSPSSIHLAPASITSSHISETITAFFWENLCLNYENYPIRIELFLSGKFPPDPLSFYLLIMPCLPVNSAASPIIVFALPCHGSLVRYSITALLAHLTLSESEDPGHTRGGRWTVVGYRAGPRRYRGRRYQDGDGPSV